MYKHSTIPTHSHYLMLQIRLVLSGLGLKTQEFAHALTRIWFNLFVQCFNFFAVSLITYGITRFLISVGAIAKSLGNGMTICSCLPMTINMITVLTGIGDGNTASSVFNAAFGNVIGLFLSPLLILGYLGVEGDLKVGRVILKLVLRVLVPILIGQVLQKFVDAVVDFVKVYKPYFKRTQEWCEVFIIYTVFCKTFLQRDVPEMGQVLLMMVLQCSILFGMMTLAWLSLAILFKNDPRLRVTGLFACTHKTVAVGVPLINTIYEHNPSVGLYTLPLLVWYPTQLLVGSFLAPRLALFVKKEELRLAGVIVPSLSPDSTEFRTDINGVSNEIADEQSHLLSDHLPVDKNQGDVAHMSSGQVEEQNQSRVNLFRRFFTCYSTNVVQN